MNCHKYFPVNDSGLVRISFDDMENIQNIRLMILAALISIVLTFLITNSIKLVYWLKGNTFRKKA